ncbi:MAG: rod shape-determining protein MreC [Ilumatobacteraceae bacterium]|nr:rod shape-determining protein MreC [Ilumatobacteraceae bacterium]
MIHDQLDDAIRSVIADITAVAPRPDDVRVPAPLRVRTTHRARWLLPAIGVTVLASLAAVVAIGVGSRARQTTTTAPAEPTATSVTPTAIPTFTTGGATSTIVAPPTTPTGLEANYPTIPATVTEPSVGSGTSVEIDRGDNDGVHVGMAVVDATGLVGDVTAVQPTSSTVRLVTDLGYSVACSVDDAAAECTGFAAEQPMRARSVTALTLPSAGRVITGGDASSTAPPGIVIGDLHDGAVDPAADLAALTTVEVVLYVPADGAPVNDDPQSLGLTGSLPDGLQIWDVTQTTGTLTQPATQQLFGTLTADGTRLDHGLLLTISPTTGYDPANDPHTATVRGLQAAVGASGSGDPQLTWEENGSIITAESHGMAAGDVNKLLDGLRWRADPQDGFDPASSTTPLISESAHHLGETHAVTSYVLARTAADLALGGNGSGPMRVTIGDSFAALSPAAVIYGGVRDATGMVVCDRCLPGTGPGTVALSPFGAVIGLVNLSHDLDAALLTAIGPVKPSQLAAQVAASTDLDSGLDVLASATVGPVTIEQRGTDAISPAVQCVVLGDLRRCRTYTVNTDAGVPPLTVTSVVLDGHWYLVAVIDSATSLPNYTTGTTSLTPTTVTEAGRTWALFTIPDDVQSVGVNGAPGDGSAARGGFLRPVTDTTSTNPPSLTAPADGSPTPGATTTTTTNVLGTPYNFTPLILDAPPNGFALESAIYFPQGRQFYGMVTYRSTTGDGTSLQLIIRPGDQWLKADWLADRQRWTINGRTVVDDSQTAGCDPDACSVGVQWDANTDISVTMSRQAGGTLAATQTIEQLRDLTGHLVIDPTAFTLGDPAP